MQPVRVLFAAFGGPLTVSISLKMAFKMILCHNKFVMPILWADRIDTYGTAILMPPAFILPF